MKKILILFLLLPFLSGAQSILDSTVFRFSQGDIRYYVVRQSATGISTDSIYVSHSGVRALLSPSQLPISTLQQAAFDLKQSSLGYTPLNPANNLSEVTASTARTNLGLGTLATQSGAFSGTWADTTRSALYAALSGKQTSITTGTTAQYFRGDLSLATFPTTTASFTSSTNKNFVTDAQLVIIGNTIGINTGDQTITLTGDITGSGTGSFATTIGALKVTNGMLAGSIVYSKLSLTGAILNADLAGSIAYSKLSLTGAILNADLAGSIAYSKLSLTGAILNADLAGSIDLTTKVTGVLPFANGGMGSTAATSATTGTISVNMTTQMITCVPSGAMTLNGTGGVTGERTTFVFTTSGVSSFVITFGTNFKSTGTLTTGTTTAKVFTVSFIYNGTSYLETGRTTAM